jgi:3-oxoacyl-[acyl-carrier protein] reductase
MPVPANADLLGLADKVALIIGGAGPGLGGAHCRQLARAGCNVAVVDVDRDGGQERVREVEQFGGKAVFIEANVRYATQVDQAVATAVGAFGRIDVAINVVGGPGTSGTRPFVNVTDDMWQDALDLTLMSAVRCCRAEARTMIAQGLGGSIINIGSIVATFGAAYLTAYAAAKSGVVSLTKALAVELGEHGIRVNCAMPGYVAGEQVQRVLADPNPTDFKRFSEMSYQAVPLSRLGEPEELAGLTVLLASRLASFVTGQDVLADGGMSLTIARHWNAFKLIMTPDPAA